MATNKDDQVITTQNTDTDNVFNNENTMNGSVQPKASTTETSSPSTTPPVTSDNDITDSSSGIDKNFQDKDDPTKYASTPNTSTKPSKSNTGSGLTAAEGTEYSWNEKAEERAGLDYQSAVLESKSNYLANRQQIESQAQEAQNQFAMKQYSQNQSNEKAGWTGGYILDTDRQVEYLKATIQAQMYGQMELQKYGYDTSLAAARLAYDTNKYDLALEYYNTALSRAVSEAEITGYYVSPETSEMLNEYSIASRILNDETSKQEEKDRANSVLNAVYKWFEDNGISKQGVETYSHIVQEREHTMALESALKYIDTANKQIDSNSFTKVDANGEPIETEDGSSFVTFNFNTATTEEILQYITNNETATQQYFGYLDGKLTQQSQDQFYDWLISKNLLTAEKQDSGTTAYVAKDGVNYETQLYKFLENSDVYKDLVESLQDMDSESANQLREIYEEWDFEIELPNGTTILRSFKDLNSAVVDNITPEGTTINPGNISSGTINDNDIKFAVSEDKSTVFTDITAEQVWHASGNNFGKPDIKLSCGDYDLEVTSEGAISGESLDTIVKSYEEAYGTKMKCGTVFVVNGQFYMYLDGTQTYDGTEHYLINNYKDAKNTAWKIQETTNGCTNGELRKLQSDFNNMGAWNTEW